MGPFLCGRATEEMLGGSEVPGLLQARPVLDRLSSSHSFPRAHPSVPWLPNSESRSCSYRREVGTQRSGVACSRSHSLEKEMGLKPRLHFESSAPLLVSHVRPGAKHHADRTPSAPSPPPGIWVPALPCRSQEADEKEEELETGPEGFSLDDTRLGLGLSLGSDPDKPSEG